MSLLHLKTLPPKTANELLHFESGTIPFNLQLFEMHKNTLVFNNNLDLGCIFAPIFAFFSIQSSYFTCLNNILIIIYLVYISTCLKQIRLCIIRSMKLEFTKYQMYPLEINDFNLMAQQKVVSEHFQTK